MGSEWENFRESLVKFRRKKSDGLTRLVGRSYRGKSAVDQWTRGRGRKGRVSWGAEVQLHADDEEGELAGDQRTNRRRLEREIQLETSRLRGGGKRWKVS
jgi:hypothetical protein